MTAVYSGPERRVKDSDGPPLRTYVETRFDLLDKSIADQLKSQEYSILSLVESTKQTVMALRETLSASQAAAEKRFEALDELRRTVLTLMTRPEADSRLGAMAERIDATNHRIDVLQGRLDVELGETTGVRNKRDETKSFIALGAAVLAVLMTLYTFVTQHAAPQQPPVVIVSPQGTVLPTAPQTGGGR